MGHPSCSAASRWRLALQLAQDDGDAVLLGQAAQLPVEQFGQVVGHVERHRLRFGYIRGLAFPHSSLRPRRSRFQGRLVCHAVEPVGDQLPMGDGMTFSGQHEERRLEGVLGVVMIPEDPAADAPHHRAVTPDEGLERRSLLDRRRTAPGAPVRKSSERAHAEERLEIASGNLHPNGPPRARPASFGVYLDTTRLAPGFIRLPQKRTGNDSGGLAWMLSGRSQVLAISRGTAVADVRPRSQVRRRPEGRQVRTGARCSPCRLVKVEFVDEGRAQVGRGDLVEFVQA